MAPGARWFCWIDPITFAFKALIPQQFYAGADGPGAPSVLLSGPTPPCSAQLPQGVPCGGSEMPGGAVVLNGNIAFNVDRYAYVSSKYDVYFEEEWASLGFLAIFIVVFQVFALYGINRIRHIVR
jgi:hypothetical protein